MIEKVKRAARSLDASPIEQFFRIIAVVSLVVGTFAILDTRAKTLCQAQYNDANNERTVALSYTNENERTAERKADDALTDLIQAITRQDPALSREEYEGLVENLRVALVEQRKERQDADASRAAHPVLGPPSADCGGFNLF